MSRNISELHPRLQEKVQQLIEQCKKQDLEIGIGECFRSVSEQDNLYAQGRTKPGSIITKAKGSTYSSQHQWGIAFDFFRNDGTGAYNESGQFFERVGAIGKSIGLGWGGDWVTIKDRPHLYLPDWGSTTTALKNTYGTFEKFKTTWISSTISKSPEITKEEITKEEITIEPDVKKEWVKRLQKEIGAKVDGIAGRETMSKSPLMKTGSKGLVVKLVQEKLNKLGYQCGQADGIFGTKTRNATKEFQKANQLMADGIIGNKTWSELLNK